MRRRSGLLLFGLVVVIGLAACVWFTGMPQSPSGVPSVTSPLQPEDAVSGVDSFEPLTSEFVLDAFPSPAAFVNVVDPELAGYALALRRPFMADLDRLQQVPRYDIALALNPAARLITGQQTTRYVNREGATLNEIMLRLYPNTAYMGGDMQVSDVVVAGAPVNWAYHSSLPDRSILRLDLAVPLTPGQALTLTLRFTISVPSEGASGYRTFGQFGSLWALPDAYAVVAPRIAGEWLLDAVPAYGDIVLSEVALYRVQIRAPASWPMVATGVCQADASQQTTTCVAAAVRDFALHLNSSYRVATANAPSGSGEPVRVSSFYLPQHERAGQSALRYATNALATFERRFGPYPYAELKVFATSATSGGIEYPTLAGVLDTFYANDNAEFEWLVAHEVAHQWWYGLVGSNPIREPWLDEALAQYSASLYLEDQNGIDAAQRYRSQAFTARYETERRQNGDQQVGQPTTGLPSQSYFPIIYGKGPLFFDEVRRGSDDARFTAWLRAYFEQRRYGIATAQDLLAAADGVGLGTVARPAFDRWILGR